jgi:hypothetical protein
MNGRLALILGFASLAAAFAPRAGRALDLVVLASEPGASVGEVSGQGLRRDLGTTPLTLDGYRPAPGSVLLIEKPGFSSAYIPLGNDDGSKVALDVKLWKNASCPPEDTARVALRRAEELVDQVLFAQRLLDRKDVRAAFPLISSLRASYPDSMSVEILYANALLMAGDLERAQTVYEALRKEIPADRKLLLEPIENVYRQLKSRARVPAGKGNP